MTKQCWAISHLKFHHVTFPLNMIQWKISHCFLRCDYNGKFPTTTNSVGVFALYRYSGKFFTAPTTVGNFSLCQQSWENFRLNYTLWENLMGGGILGKQWGNFPLHMQTVGKCFFLRQFFPLVFLVGKQWKLYFPTEQFIFF